MGRENEIKAKMEVAKIFLIAAVGTFLLGISTGLSNIDKISQKISTSIGAILGIIFLGWIILNFHRRYIDLGIALDREQEK